MKKILIPVDFSENSKHAVDEGKFLAKSLGADAVLLHVLPDRLTTFKYPQRIPDLGVLNSYIENEKNEAQVLMEEFKKDFDALSINTEIVFLSGLTADELIDYINNKDIDYVVMGSHGIGSTLHRAFLGSVTNKVLHYAEKPILVVR